MIVVVIACLALALPAAAEDAPPPAAGTPAQAEALAEAEALFEAGAHGEALEALRPLAEAGVFRAIYRMGHILAFSDTVPSNYEAAHRLLRAAAAAAANAEPQDPYTYRAAVSRLGYLHDLGRGVHEDDRTAECMYRIAAEMGNRSAQWNLSVLIQERPGIDPESLYWTERSAAQGNLLALGTLGYIRSINPYQDQVEGIVLMMVARDLGHALSKIRLDEYEAMLDPDVQDMMHEARVRKPDWRAVPEEPPASFSNMIDGC